MVRALTLALLLTWLVASAAVACEPPPENDATDAAGGIRAQTIDATPAIPNATDPAACAVEPRTLEELRQLVMAGSQATPTAPTASPISALPTGEPADIATIAAITATVEQLMACGNSGDMLRTFALFTDDFLRTYAADFTYLLEDMTDPTTLQPLDEEEWVTLGEVSGTRVLSDGRVGALVIPAPPDDDEPVFLIFVQEGDRWLIDAYIEIEESDEDCCAAPTTTTTSWQPVQGDGYDGVIVPEADAPLFFRSLDGQERAGYWTPAEADIQRLESDLAFFLMPPPCGESPAPDQIWQKIETYHRQYAGYVADDGRRLIFVNAFCDDLGIDWRSQPVAVLDGGACFFQITYDPATGDFSDLQVNGEA